MVLAWGRAPVDVSGLGVQHQFVDATPAQANELVELEKFLRKPDAWALPPDMLVQPKATPFVPTHLWVSWDRSEPDPSKLPSPAREVLISNLQPVLTGRCGVITIAQAEQIVQAMEQVGLTKYMDVSPRPDDVTDGIAFDMPGQRGGVSFLHAHPALPDESTCD